MADGINKVPSLKTLITHCKNVVTKLHFKGDVVEDELMKTYSAQMVKTLVDKVDAAFDLFTADTNTPIEELRLSHSHGEHEIRI
jgi:hypothetical protein